MPVKSIPDGYRAVIPYLMINGADKFIAFMTTVFNAEVTEQLRQPDGGIGHTELRIGNAMIMLSEARGAFKATPVMLHVYVEDADTTFNQAIKAGGTIVAPLADQFYGDRAGGILEPSGNTIWIATHIEDVSPDELQRRATAQHKP